MFLPRAASLLRPSRANEGCIELNGKNLKETDLVRVKEAKIRSFVDKKSWQHWLGGRLTTTPRGR